ncbi:MAG: signal peptidase I [Chloroflexi bacterium]|jgi:signal peptidase I|nr:MAG: signal peptidase I [Chloroflexota bacterium]
MQRLRYGATRDVLETVLLALIVFLLAREVVQNFQVEGSSMSPTLHDSDFVLVNKFAYKQVDMGPFDFLLPGRSNGEFLFGGPSRGDVVVFHSPADPTRDFVKRVIGEPGDRIQISNGEVRINGQQLDESQYILSDPAYRYPQPGMPAVVPPEHYFVLGDNRNASQDSHVFGPIHQRLFVGEVIFRWLPLDAIGGGGSRDLIAIDGSVIHDPDETDVIEVRRPSPDREEVDVPTLMLGAVLAGTTT